MAVLVIHNANTKTIPIQKGVSPTMVSTTCLTMGTMPMAKHLSHMPTTLLEASCWAKDVVKLRWRTVLVIFI